MDEPLAALAGGGIITANSLLARSLTLQFNRGQCVTSRMLQLSKLVVRLSLRPRHTSCSADPGLLPIVLAIDIREGRLPVASSAHFARF